MLKKIIKIIKGKINCILIISVISIGVMAGFKALQQQMEATNNSIGIDSYIRTLPGIN